MKRSKATIILAALILGAGVLSSQAVEKKAEPKAQTTCPVMGGKINQAQYVDVNGLRIYVCCPGCISKIKAEPQKYIDKLKSEGVAIEKAIGTKKAAPQKKSGGCCGH